MARSGTFPDAIAVWNFCSAESQGMAVTSTVTSGFSFSNAARKSGSNSPSVPMAHILMVPVAGPSSSAAGAAVVRSVVSARPQPVSASDVATMSADAARIFLITAYLSVEIESMRLTLCALILPRN